MTNLIDWKPDWKSDDSNVSTIFIFKDQAATAGA